MGKLIAFTSIGVMSVLALVLMPTLLQPGDQSRLMSLSIRPGLSASGKAVAQYAEEGLRVPAQVSRDGARVAADANAYASGGSSASCRERVRTMDAELDALKANLVAQRQTVDQLDGRLAGLKTDLDRISAENPRGIPAALYDAYTVQAQNFNTTLDQRRAAGLQHNAVVNEISSRLEERNAVARGC